MRLYNNAYWFIVVCMIRQLFLVITRWDAEGPYKPLHALNPTRLAFIRSTLCHHFRWMFSLLVQHNPLQKEKEKEKKYKKELGRKKKSCLSFILE